MNNTEVRAGILAIGSELVEGYGLDTNSQWISHQLTQRGALVVEHRSVGDHIEDIARALGATDDLTVRVVTGGLGPTFDDLTRDAVAAHYAMPLAEDAKALQLMREWFAGRGRVMSETNRVQAMLPRGCVPIYNMRGTAPGFHIERNGRHLFVVPGVPTEMRGMMEEYILPIVESLSKNLVRVGEVSLFGVPESKVQEILAANVVFERRNPELAVLVNHGLVRIVSKAMAQTQQQAQELIERDRAQWNTLFADNVIGQQGETLERRVFDLLSAKRKTIATAESCTGGLLSSMLTDVPGMSRWFLQGYVTYSNQAKTQSLGVPEQLLDRVGAVSEEVARVMAEGALQRSGADLACGITGIAGPGGGTMQKPLGLVYTSVAAKGIATEVKKNQFHGERSNIKKWAAQTTLDMIRGVLEQL